VLPEWTTFQAVLASMSETVQEYGGLTEEEIGFLGKPGGSEALAVGRQGR
jgi:hypothetical protein